MSRDVIFRDEAVEFNEFDREFGEFLLRYARISSVELKLAGMLLTRELRNGRTKLDLNEYSGKPVPWLDDNTLLIAPEKVCTS